MYRLLYPMLLLVPVLADYDCVCNYNVEEGVYDTPSKTGPPFGYLYQFDCKPLAGNENAQFRQILYEHKVRYIENNTNVRVQTCPGDMPNEDKLTTTVAMTTAAQSTTQATTPKLTTKIVNTHKPATTPPTTSTSVRTTTPIPTTTRTTAPVITKKPEGNIALCPDFVKNTDVQRYHGFLGQYGEFCYELVNEKTQWTRAEKHCSRFIPGHLVQVLNQWEQDYIVRFLSKHHYVQSVWLGLNDRGGDGREGKFRWSSGAPFAYHNFPRDFDQNSGNTHNTYDCMIMKQGGEWTDVFCGVSLTHGFGFGDGHPFICQYNISSTLPSIAVG